MEIRPRSIIQKVAKRKPSHLIIHTGPMMVILRKQILFYCQKILQVNTLIRYVAVLNVVVVFAEYICGVNKNKNKISAKGIWWTWQTSPWQCVGRIQFNFVCLWTNWKWKELFDDRVYDTLLYFVMTTTSMKYTLPYSCEYDTNGITNR